MGHRSVIVTIEQTGPLGLDENLGENYAFVIPVRIFEPDGAVLFSGKMFDHHSVGWDFFTDDDRQVDICDELMFNGKFRDRTDEIEEAVYFVETGFSVFGGSVVDSAIKILKGELPVSYRYSRSCLKVATLDGKASLQWIENLKIDEEK